MSKYRFEIVQSDANRTVLVEGQIPEGRVLIQIDGSAEYLDVPIESEETREIAVSTNFVAAVGQIVCTFMGLTPDYLNRTILLREALLSGREVETEGRDAAIVPDSNKKSDLN